MRPDDAVDTLVQHLLGDPVAGLAAIRRDTHKRRHRRCQTAGPQDLPAIQHVLQTVPQCADVVWTVFHLEHYAIVRRGVYRLGNSNFRRDKTDEGGLTLLQGANHAVETRCFGHCRTPFCKKISLCLPSGERPEMRRSTHRGW